MPDRPSRGGRRDQLPARGDERRRRPGTTFPATTIPPTPKARGIQRFSSTRCTSRVSSTGSRPIGPARTAEWCAARCGCSVRSTPATRWSGAAASSTSDARLLVAHTRYLVDLEVSVSNQRGELCCPAEVTLELPGYLGVRNWGFAHAPRRTCVRNATFRGYEVRSGSLPALTVDCSSTYSDRPSAPNSRPMPDCLNPPNGRWCRACTC